MKIMNNKVLLQYHFKSKEYKFRWPIVQFKNNFTAMQLIYINFVFFGYQYVYSISWCRKGWSHGRTAGSYKVTTIK